MECVMEMDFNVPTVPFPEFVQKVNGRCPRDVFESERTRGLYHHIRYRDVSDATAELGSSASNIDDALQHNKGVVDHVGVGQLSEMMEVNPVDIKQQMAHLDTVSQETHDEFLDMAGRSLVHLSCILDVFGLNTSKISDFEHWNARFDTIESDYCFQKIHLQIVRALSGVGKVPNSGTLHTFYGMTWAMLEDFLRGVAEVRSEEMHAIWVEQFDPLDNYSTCCCDGGE